MSREACAATNLKFLSQNACLFNNIDLSKQIDGIRGILCDVTECDARKNGGGTPNQRWNIVKRSIDVSHTLPPYRARHTLGGYCVVTRLAAAGEFVATLCVITHPTWRNTQAHSKYEIVKFD